MMQDPGQLSTSQPVQAPPLQPTMILKRTHKKPAWASMPAAGPVHQQPRPIRVMSFPDTAHVESSSAASLEDSPGELRKEILYLSIDCETDGPVPGLYSCLSIGLCGFNLIGEIVWEREVNLFPLDDAAQDRRTMDWWAQPEQRDAYLHLLKQRQDPKETFIRLSEEIKDLKRTYRVFTVAWPSGFDWAFINYYFYRFVGENPLGRSAKCAQSYAWALARTMHPNVSIQPLLDGWADDRFPHTHKALDDAREQGAKFINMLREATKNGKHYRLGGNKKKHVPKGTGVNTSPFRHAK